jgi:nitrate reductase gamma subunit
LETKICCRLVEVIAHVILRDKTSSTCLKIGCLRLVECRVLLTKVEASLLLRRLIERIGVAHTSSKAKGLILWLLLCKCIVGLVELIVLLELIRALKIVTCSERVGESSVHLL